MTVLHATSRTLAAVVLTTGLTTGTAAAAGAPRPHLAIRGALNGVVAVSSHVAWAVGSSAGHALVLRWTGSRWTASTPAAGSLSAVDALSATNAWAVGATATGKSLIIRWNGHRWARVPSPSPGSGATLTAVAAVTARDVWAVGSYFAAAERTLILHWTGTAWRRVTSPLGALSAVDARSAHDVWAVGYRFVPKLNAARTLALHWNGRRWQAVRTPGPVGNGAGFGGVTAASAGRTWAVGCTGCGIGGFADSLTARWQHGAWQVPRGGRVAGGDLSAVATVRTGSAWAVGGRYARPGDSQSVRTFIRFWNGTTWRTQQVASPGAEASLGAVSASSPTNAWAVGSYQRSAGNAASARTLIVHWNGKAWR